MEHFGSHLGAEGRHGDSKWPSKGPAREPKEALEPWEKAGRKSDDFGGTIAWVSDTLAPLGRVPACTGAHFRHLLILLSLVGKGFLKENPGFPEGLPERRENLNRSKNNEAPHANSARSTVADFLHFLNKFGIVYQKQSRANLTI